MEKILSVNPVGYSGYDITIKRSVLLSAGTLTRPLTNAKRAAIVTDSNVAPIFLKKVIDSYKSAGFDVFSFSFPAGEASKNLETVSKILDFFCISRLTRTDIAIALGGGVVGDLVGFAAAIYLRGIDFVQIPTTLLAQVDSSVGGKTGCDLPSGKNLCGAFHNPIAVFIDTETLKTLPQKYMRDGYSEAIKSGAILVPKLFELFENGAENRPDDIVYLSAGMKAGVVERDFTEHGERIFLNFGHTLGHAIERYENFNGLTHGQAVSIGMALITQASEKAGITEKGTYNRLVKILKSYNLPYSTEIPLKDLVTFCKNDKKSCGSSVKLVLIKNIGSAFVKEIAWDRLLAFFEDGVL